MKWMYGLLVIVFCSSILLGCVTVEDGTPAEEGTVMEDQTSHGQTAGEDMAVGQEVAPENGEMAPEAEGWGNECETEYDCDWTNQQTCKKGYCVDRECVFSSSCPEDNHCFNGKCYSEAELYAEFPECYINMIYCEIGCPGCKGGKQRCTMTGHSEGDTMVDYRICVDCTLDSHCIEGYRCVDSQCIPGPDQ